MIHTRRIPAFHLMMMIRCSYAEIMNDDVFTLGSRHLSYAFRHSRLTHEDGSLSLNGLLNHGGTTRKIRQMNRQGHRKLKEIDETQIGRNMRSRNTAIVFMMPLAHICCNSNKSRVQIGYLTRNEFMNLAS